MEDSLQGYKAKQNHQYGQAFLNPILRKKKDGGGTFDHNTLRT